MASVSVWYQGPYGKQYKIYNVCTKYTCNTKIRSCTSCNGFGIDLVETGWTYEKHGVQNYAEIYTEK